MRGGDGYDAGPTAHSHNGDLAGWVLAVDYGTATTKAILATPGGHHLPILQAGAPMPSGVLADPETGALLAGVAAVRRAVDRPDCYLADPKRLVRDGVATVSLGRRLVTTVEAVAAPLALLAAEAARLTAGAPVHQVVMGVPVGWGPKRRGVVRAAVTHAGLPEPTLVATPVAVATAAAAAGAAAIAPVIAAPARGTADVAVAGLPITATTAPPPVGGCWLIADAAASALILTVVAPSTSGVQVLATVELPQAAGTTIDDAFLDYAGRALAQEDPERWGRLTAPQLIEDHRDRFALSQGAQAAKHLLGSTERTVIALPPPHLPAVVDRHTLTTITAPWRDELPTTVQALLTAADVDPTGLSALILTGGGAPLPDLAQALHAATRLTPLIMDSPDTVARGLLVMTQPQPTSPAPTPTAHSMAPLWTTSPVWPTAQLPPALATLTPTQPPGQPAARSPGLPQAGYPQPLPAPPFVAGPALARLRATLTGTTSTDSNSNSNHQGANPAAGIFSDAPTEDGVDRLTHAVYRALPTWVPTTVSLVLGAATPPLLALASLVLLLQGLSTTERSGITDYRYWAAAPTPQLTLAAILTITAGWATAHLIAVLLTIGAAPPWGHGGARFLRAAFLAAAGFGLGTTVLYGLFVSKSLGVPGLPYGTKWLPQMLAGTATTAIAATTIALMVPRIPTTTRQAWLRHTRVPLTGILCATLGVFLMRASGTNTAPADALGTALTARTGALLLGVGAALTLTRNPILRITAAAGLALTLPLLYTWPNVRYMVIAYLCAITCWALIALTNTARLVYLTGDGH